MTATNEPCVCGTEFGHDCGAMSTDRLLWLVDQYCAGRLAAEEYFTAVDRLAIKAIEVALNEMTARREPPA